MILITINISYIHTNIKQSTALYSIISIANMYSIISFISIAILLIYSWKVGLYNTILLRFMFMLFAFNML